MPKVKFVARHVYAQETIPESGVDKGETELTIGLLDIEDKTVIAILTALKGECTKGTGVEAWRKDDNQNWSLIAKR